MINLPKRGDRIRRKSSKSRSSGKINNGGSPSEIRSRAVSTTHAFQGAGLGAEKIRVKTGSVEVVIRTNGRRQVHGREMNTLNVQLQFITRKWELPSSSRHRSRTAIVTDTSFRIAKKISRKESPQIIPVQNKRQTKRTSMRRSPKMDRNDIIQWVVENPLEPIYDPAARPPGLPGTPWNRRPLGPAGPHTHRKRQFRPGGRSKPD
ncbi:MAG: hypothetical protein CMJ81_02080 [Planctomycetaceae bacterium]|nr:hypothetical protein [Planctomycetaceae bacterium]MBP61189.1 hypothetical protein [Planctomycetaceae bacterium]